MSKKTALPWLVGGWISLSLLVGCQPISATGAGGQVLPVAPLPVATPQERAISPCARRLRFHLVPEESAAGFRAVEHWLKPESTEIVRGRTGLITGTLELDPLVQPPTVTVSIITVNVAGLTTHDRDLDAALRDTYLQSKTFPLATFTPRQILDLPTTCAEDKPVTFRLVGDLTIRTIVKPVEFTVTAQLTGDTITGEARALLRMTSFGITPPSKTGLSWVENEVTVICTFVARTAPL